MFLYPRTTFIKLSFHRTKHFNFGVMPFLKWNANLQKLIFVQNIFLKKSNHRLGSLHERQLSYLLSTAYVKNNHKNTLKNSK